MNDDTINNDTAPRGDGPRAATEPRRNPVVRADGEVVHIVRPRAQLFVCATGCCCGRTDDGFPAVPTQLYHDEWSNGGSATLSI
jgi:hypothetical protein